MRFFFQTIFIGNFFVLLLSRVLELVSWVCGGWAAGALWWAGLVKTRVWRHFVSILGFFVLSSSSPPFAPLAPALASRARPEPVAGAKSQRKNSLLWSEESAAKSVSSYRFWWLALRQWEAAFFVRLGAGGRDPTNKDIFSDNLGGAWRYLCFVNTIAMLRKLWSSSLILSSFHFVFVPELARSLCSLEVSESLCQ